MIPQGPVCQYFFSRAEFWLVAVVLAVFLVPDQVIGQRSSYRIGKTEVGPVLILDEGGFLRSYRIAVQTKDSVVYLGPEVVDEYVSYKGEHFRSYELPEGDRAFLEVVEEGNITLLFLVDSLRQKRFFLELAPGAILEMDPYPDQELYYREVLQAAWRECDQLSYLLEEATFQRASLRYVVRAHNTCKYVPAPKGRTFVSAEILYQRAALNPGLSASSDVPTGALRIMELGWNVYYGLRAVREQPLFSTNWFGVVGLQMQYFRASDVVPFSLRSLGDRRIRVEVQTFDLGIPLGIRYIHPGNRLRPHLYFGAAPSFFLINQLTGEINIFAASGQAPQNIPVDEQLARFGLAGQLGAGLDFSLNAENVIRVELGYQQRWTSGSDKLLDFSQLKLGVGLGW